MIEASSRAITKLVHLVPRGNQMYHPFDQGTFWVETHYPSVRIYREVGTIEVKIFLKPAFVLLLEKYIPSSWTFDHYFNRDWAIYTFNLQKGAGQKNLAEIKALNTFLNFCTNIGNNEKYVATVTEKANAQLAFTSADNPTDFHMGCCGILSNMSCLVTDFLVQHENKSALEQFITSRMKGIWKILYPESQLSRSDVDMHLYRTGNPVPVFRASGQCACLSVTSNQLDSEGGFLLSPHNIDSHYNQFVLLSGALMVWEQARKSIRKR